MNEKTEFGGRLSVRKEQELKPLFIFGHDECIFKQFTLTKKAWVGPNGETAVVLKDEGMGVMISAFQSREFGFGLQLNNEQLERVNAFHEGKNYMDKDTATAKKGTVTIKPLTLSPIIQEFEYGTAGEGYWSYQHMVLQLDDCLESKFSTI